MHSALLLSVLSLAGALAFPGSRQIQHHHHAKRNDVVVYATVQVTEFVTMTAGQSVAEAVQITSPITTEASATPMAATQFDNKIAAQDTTTSSSNQPVPTTFVQSTTPLPSSSSTSSTSAATPVSSSSSGSTQKGLGWDVTNPSSMASLFSSGYNWYFNWGTSPTSSMTEEFIYQQWGSNNLGNLATVPTGATVIGFNEPDGSGQATMTAAAAAALYLSNFTPLKKTGQIGYLGTPSITNGGGSAGIAWLTQFMDACSDCEIDFVSAHWYGPSMTLFESQMTALHTAFGLPIWLSEFACTNWDAATNPSQSAVSSFMSDSVSWMKSQSFMARYAWFGALVITDTSLGTANSLVTSDGSALSDLGKQYMAL